MPRILIIRLSALGDVVFATSLLDSLRTHYPQAHIGWLIQEGFAGILDGDSRVDEVITMQRTMLRSPRALLRLRKRLAASRFEWAVDSQGLAKSRLLAALTPGAVRVGFNSKEPGKFLMREVLPKGGDDDQIAGEYRYLAERLTGHVAAPPSLVVTAAMTEHAHATMRRLGLGPGFIALCPFTTRPQKHWMEDYWPKLAQRLASSGKGPFVVFGGPADRVAAERIHARLPTGSINLAGHTRLDELAAWLTQAGLVIGVDTGLTHIGVAVRRPTLALFGSTCPYTGGAESPLTVMYDGLPCAPCRRNPTCGGDWTCMRQLTPERVAAAATRLSNQDHWQ